jgi:hypothetical protein
MASYQNTMATRRYCVGFTSSRLSGIFVFPSNCLLEAINTRMHRNSTPARNLGFGNFWISIFELAQNLTPGRNRVLKILNFDFRAGSKFNSSSKFGFWKFWISIFEMARNSTSARNSGFENLEFRYSSCLKIQLQLWFYFEFRSLS